MHNQVSPNSREGGGVSPVWEGSGKRGSLVLGTRLDAF